METILLHMMLLLDGSILCLDAILHDVEIKMRGHGPALFKFTKHAKLCFFGRKEV